MFNITITLQELQNQGILKQVLNKLNLEHDYTNVHLWLTKDYLNNSLPEKYSLFIPDLSKEILLELPDECLLKGIQVWLYN
jgi:hypothetical protein